MSSDEPDEPPNDHHVESKHLDDPAAKKRKVQRACDLCRRKKVRCDGAQTDRNVCSNCTAVGIQCTYISEAKKRGPPKGYVESLEKRIEKMESLLQKLAPGIDIEAELTQQAAESVAHLPIGGPSTDGKHKSSSPLNTTNKADAGEVTLLQDLARELSGSCKPRSVLELPDDCYDTSEDDFGPGTLPDVITDAMQDLSIQNTKLSHSRFHGKSSSLMLVRAASDLKKEHGHPEVTEVSGIRRPEFWTPSAWERELHQDASPPGPVSFPPEDLMGTLFDLFFRHFTPFLPIIHEPSFRMQVVEGHHFKNTSFAIVVLLVCAIASRYCSDKRVCLPEAGPRSAGWKYFVQVKELKRSIHAPAKLSDLQTYALAAYYLQTTSAPHSAWTVIGIGIRCAQDIGVHRKKIYKGTISLAEEQWKRVFWCLIILDRNISSALGRPLACQDEDFDVDFPEEIDDEHWDSGSYGVPKQPAGVPSKISYFVAYLKLGQILAFALRTIYTINKSKVLLGFVGPQWEQHIIAELDSAMNKWLNTVPDHLRWDPNRENQMHFEQSAVLYSSYYHLHILIHRPFIPSPKKPAILSFPSLTICTNAARSCSHVLESYGKRSLHVPPSTVVAAFTSGVILLISIWGAKKTGLNVDYRSQMKDVDKCLNFLRKSEQDWKCSGSLVDILCELASFGDVQLQTVPYNAQNKRDREYPDGNQADSEDRLVSSAITDKSRPRRPIPKAKHPNGLYHLSARATGTRQPSNGAKTSASASAKTAPNVGVDGEYTAVPENPLPSASHVAGISPQAAPFEWNSGMIKSCANTGASQAGEAGERGVPLGLAPALDGKVLGAMGMGGLPGQWYGPTGGIAGAGGAPQMLNGDQPFGLDGAGHTALGDMLLPNFLTALGPGASGHSPTSMSDGAGDAAGGMPSSVSGSGSTPMTPGSATKPPSPGSASATGPPAQTWGGILSSQQQPYNLAFTAHNGVLDVNGLGDAGMNFFPSVLGYQGAGGSMILAAEAQAILGSLATQDINGLCLPPAGQDEWDLERQGSNIGTGFQYSLIQAISNGIPPQMEIPGWSDSAVRMSSHID